MLSSPTSFGMFGDWKMEEMSPCTSPQHLYSSSPLHATYNDIAGESSASLTLFDDCSFDNVDKYENSINLIKDPLKDEIVEFTTESKARVASKLLDDLDHLEHLDQWIKEEPLPFSDWLEEKIDLPIFGDIASPLLPAPSVQVQPVILIASAPQNQNGIQIISKSANYFTSNPENVKNEVLVPAEDKNSISTSITIPNDTQTLIQEFENVFEQVTLTPPQSPQNPAFTIMQPVPMIQPDVAKELAVVDELVRCRAEGLAYTSWDESSSSATTPLSPATSSSSGSEDCTDDPEWVPETVNSQDYHPVVKISKRNRSKPYDRPVVEDKKSRKKEQNKNAATRYRQKKKAEIAVILGEEKGLQDTNDKLQSEVSDLSREIKYLKGLMRDLFKAKGLIA